MMTDDASLLEKGVTSSSQPAQPEFDPSGPPPPYTPPEKVDTFLIVKEPKASPEWRDLWAAIAFIIHLVVYIGIAFAAIGRGANLGGTVSPEEQRGLSGSLLASCFYSTLVAVLFLLLSRRFATQVIYASGIISIAIVFFFGILCFVYLNVISGLIWLFFAVLMAVIFFFMRKRIPFAAAMLETVVGVIFSFPSLYFASGVGFVVLIAWTLLFIYAVSAAVIVWSGGALSFLLIYCTFSYYWTTQVLKNTLHVTSSGLFASYYFFAGTAYFPGNPVLGSFRRAITYSFGSVCFGSLLVALVRTLRFLLRLILGSHDCLRFLLDCVLGIFERLLRYFNHYAYTEIAIYGMNFCQAGRSVMDLFPVYGLDAVIQDDLIGNVLVIITIICGAGSFGIGYGISLAFTHDVGSATVFACICLFVGSMVGIVITDIVESGTATTLVCLCEDPRSLQRSKPDLYLKLKVAHPSTKLP